MAVNMRMSLSFIKQIEDAGIKYLQYENFDEIEHITDADVFIDELLKLFPSRGTEPLPPHQMDWLTQGAKSGIQLYCTTQDFSQVHKQFRLLTNKVYMIRKLFGSPRPMKSSPPVKSIWGICIKKSVKPETFKGDTASMETDFIPIPFTIRKKDTLRYDTLYKIPRAELPDLKLRKQRVYAQDKQGNIVFEKIQFR